MTFSEFGRRPEENGDQGTDHGTAAPLFVIGDHVNGGLHGAQPSLTNLDDDGNLVPAVDFRAVYAERVARLAARPTTKAVLGKIVLGALAVQRRGPAAAVHRLGVRRRGLLARGPEGRVHGFGSGDQVRFDRARGASRSSRARRRRPTRACG